MLLLNNKFKIFFGDLLLCINWEINGMFLSLFFSELMVLFVVFGNICIKKLLVILIELLLFINIDKLIVDGICLDCVK